MSRSTRNLARRLTDEPFTKQLRNMNNRSQRISLVVLGAILLASCEQAEQIQDRFRDLTPYEAYQESLAAAGLTLHNDGSAELVLG